MITFNKNNTTFKFKFAYPDKQEKEKNRRLSICFLTVIKNVTDEEKYSFVAHRNLKDKWNKISGAKVAFTKALNSLGELLSREDRKFLWEEFFKIYPHK